MTVGTILKIKLQNLLYISFFSKTIHHYKSHQGGKAGPYNGLFSTLFSLIPLLTSNYKKIISVRGMLHPGALSQKALKKGFLFFF